MAVTIRMTRTGGKKEPHYRLVAVDSRSPRDGKFLEILGSYDPTKDAKEARIKAEAVQKWLSRGAQVSPTVRSLLGKHGIRAKVVK
jgi:small subunit ribosomal protein S16